MAILGFHVVVCLIAITALSKMGPRSSFISLFITAGLYRFVSPSNNELRSLLPQTKEKITNRNRRKKREEQESEGFNVPKSAPFQLHLMPVQTSDLQHFEMYTSLHWLCLCIPVCLFVYSLSEIFNYVAPDNKDFNLTTILILVIAGFVLQIMAALTSWLVSNVDERGFMLSIGALYFLFSCIFAMSADRIFDIKMLEAYDRIGTNIAEFIKEANVFNGTDIVDYRPDNPLLLYISLSVFFSALSAMLVFPNFRYALMYLRAIENDGAFRKVLNHLAFLIPSVVLVTFVSPVKQQMIDGPRKFLTQEQVEIARIYLVLAWLVLKAITRVSHLQAHLNLSYEKIAEMQKESGTVKNYTVQSMVLRYYSYICYAALQYYGPVVLAALFALLLKTTGQLSWLGKPYNSPEHSLSSLGPLRFVFDDVVCKAFFSFLLLVTVLINFSLSLMGVVYHNYFARA